MKRILSVLCVSMLLVSTLYADEKSPSPQNVLLQTSMGDIVIEPDRVRAPQTVENFLAYVRDGFYDGTLFHRVIKGFMIQGGGFTDNMQLKDTRSPITNEADNQLKNTTGTIAMARTRAPHSATSQFFINVHDNAFLDHTSKTLNGWGYCVFGKVIAGMDVVRAIENVPTTTRGGHRDVPEEPVLIISAKIMNVPSSK